MSTKQKRNNKEELIAKTNQLPEKADGNNEYKLLLSDATKERFEHMLTQMRFRMSEGQGECIYTLGVTDSGGQIGISKEEYEESKKIIDDLALKSNYSVTVLTESFTEDNRKMYEILIRENNPIKYSEVKIACAGNVDSGKSSLLGVLLTGENDDGRGRARLNVFNFQHEIKSGRTSSIAHHILGFDGKGNAITINDEHGRKQTWPELVKKSSKIISFFDLCGHEKYLRTTISGLTSQYPDLVMILVGANMGVTKMTKEHIFLCLSLHIPFIIVVSKIDICEDRQNVLKETVQQIKSLIKSTGIRRVTCDVKNKEDVLLTVKNIHSFAVVPTFYVSSVTGEGINLLRDFLNLFNKNSKILENETKVEFHLEQSFQVTGVGIVLGGQLVNGKVKIGDKLLLGPTNNEYITVQIKSIHCKRVPVEEIDSGRYVCLALKKIDNKNLVHSLFHSLFHKGNVMISIKDNPFQVWEFDADIAVLRSHSTTINIGFEPVVHTSCIRQTARIISITNKICTRSENETDTVLRTGDKATVRFRFCYWPQYIKIGYRILLAEGPVKIIGKITNIVPETCTIVD